MTPIVTLFTFPPKPSSVHKPAEAGAIIAETPVLHGGGKKESGMRATRGGLPDHIRPGVRILFVGINPGLRSAAVGHHFAGYSNRFWKLLFDSGLVPERLTYLDDARLPEWGFGITNMVVRPSAGMDALKPADYRHGLPRLLAKVRRYRPKVVALLGVTLYSVLFPDERSQPLKRPGPPVRARVGLQPSALAGVRVFVLPNPSGRNAQYSYHQMRGVYAALRKFMKSDVP